MFTLKPFVCEFLQSSSAIGVHELVEIAVENRHHCRCLHVDAIAFFAHQGIRLQNITANLAAECYFPLGVVTLFNVAGSFPLFNSIEPGLEHFQRVIVVLELTAFGSALRATPVGMWISLTPDCVLFWC